MALCALHSALGDMSDALHFFTDEKRMARLRERRREEKGGGEEWRRREERKIKNQLG